MSKSKNPFYVSYNELIQEQERMLVYLQSACQGKVLCGQMTSWTLQQRTECCKVLIRLLKKARKDPQLNLNDEFDKMKGDSWKGVTRTEDPSFLPTTDLKYE